MKIVLFKLSQVSQMEPQTYMDIGHDTAHKDCKVALWQLEYGSQDIDFTWLTPEQISNHTLHGAFFSGDNVAFSGRYDSCQKMISVASPDKTVDDVPPPLARGLYSLFGENNLIYFEPFNAPMRVVNAKICT